MSKQQNLNLEFRVEKIIKRKVNKPCVKRKSYGNFFNSWTDK